VLVCVCGDASFMDKIIFLGGSVHYWKNDGKFCCISVLTSGAAAEKCQQPLV